MSLIKEGSIRAFDTHITGRAMWSSEDPPQYTGAIGKVEKREEKEEIQ